MHPSDIEITAVEAILTINQKGIVQSYNPAAEQMFGYPAGEVLGKNVSMLMSSPYREQHDGYIKNYQKTGKSKESTLREGGIELTPRRG